MTWGSTVPAALTNLVAVFQAALPEHTVQNGPTVTGDPLDEWTTVANQDINTQPVQVDGNMLLEGYAVQPEREQYTVNCVITVLSGDDDYTVPRARVFAILAAYGAALAANPNLSGAVMNARIGPYSLRRDPTDTQVTELPFGVVVDAFTTT